MKLKEKFGLSVMPKFNKKISVADIKQYLVEEFDNNKKLQDRVYTLEDNLKQAKEYEVKYELSLTTLEEFKSRVENTKARNKHLEEQIKSFQETIKKQTYEISDLKLENKKMEKHIKDIEKDIRKEVSKEYKEKINALKGRIKKSDLLEMFK